MTTTCKSNHSNLHQAQVEQEGPGVILSHQESRSDPEIRQKIDLPGKADFVSKKSKSEIRQNLIQLNETGPNLASSVCQRRRSPSASSDCQWRRIPQSQQSQEVIPALANIVCREPRGPKHPGALTCHPDTLKEVTRGQQSTHTQRPSTQGSRGWMQIRFLAVARPRKPGGENGT